MKRRDLVRRIAKAARARGVPFLLDSQGANHEIWRCGGVRFPIPRHREIDEHLAEAIFRELAETLGERWWKKR